MRLRGDIQPLLLCGGSGTRLWPLSRKSYPKQFATFAGSESLLQSAARRLSGDGFALPLIATSNDFRFIVTEQLGACGIAPSRILIEPAPRNTAPAILAAALVLAQDCPQALLLVAPTDHVIPDAAAFRAAVFAAAPRARAGDLVTFGIVPTRAETGYGYLELSAGACPAASKPQPLARFVEKPDAVRACEMMASGRCLWNAGIFLFSAESLIAAFRTHAPEVLAPVTAAVAAARSDLGFTRLAADAWQRVPNVSIDYAIMEKAANLAVMPFASGWSDLGDWEAVRQQTGPNDAGNVTCGHATALDCTGTLLRSESEQVELVGIGLRDIVAVATRDAVLVAHKSQTQRVRDAVEALGKKGAVQAESSPVDHRPWGWFETLVAGERFRVKCIHVHPRASLSLQSHCHRAEHWVVVSGTARVTIGDEVREVGENQSVYIPQGAMHRLENATDAPLTLIEVQTGSYLGEDDILRHQDIYARDHGATG
jgi:mannose-1-phosphate guanylyltransferase / mannose-6-phosphate isomerase